MNNSTDKQDGMTAQDGKQVDLVTMIAAAYVSKNHVQPAEVAGLIRTVHAALAGLAHGITAPAAEPPVDKPTPAQIRKSITREALISFEDGRPYKALRRHLTMRGLTPEAYRAKWGLPRDYPMTSAGYSETRSALAKSLGLGRVGRMADVEAPPAAEPEAPKQTRGRKPKEPATAE